MQQNSISLKTSCAYEHWQNGYAEKAIQDICQMSRCLLEYGKVPSDMWGWAVRYAVCIQNRLIRQYCVEFLNKHKRTTGKTEPQHMLQRDEEGLKTKVQLVKLEDNTTILQYDDATQRTQTVLDWAEHVYAARLKEPPITRHEPKPKSFAQAMRLAHAKRWYQASIDDVQGLDKMKTWESVRPRPGIIPIHSK